MAVDWNSPKIIEAVRRGAVKGVGIGIALVEDRAVYLITQTAKSGRIYRRRGVKHQASAPGQPFANDSGDTLKRRKISVDAGALRGTLSFRSINAARMEFGTKKMKARPYARRALMETRRGRSNVIFAEIVGVAQAISLDILPAIRATLIGEHVDIDTSDITALIGEYRGTPAVFAFRPVPEDAPPDIILINDPASITDADGLTSDRPILLVDIAVYGRKGTPGDPSDQSEAIIAAAFKIRTLFHRQRFSVRPEGYSVIQIRATGPIPAPVDDDGEIGRIVTLTIELRRTS